uniref:Activin_recp domain-containing protein n=1 Tax=Parastrongyloides trichosuri TaxID=131310 RepID=A0A0N4ZTP0_PARTI
MIYKICAIFLIVNFVTITYTIDCIAQVKGFDTLGFPPVLQTPYTCTSNTDACAKVEGSFNGREYLYKGCNNDFIRYIQTFDTFSNCTLNTCTTGRIRMDGGQNLITSHCCCGTDKCNSSSRYINSIGITTLLLFISKIYQKIYL